MSSQRITQTMMATTLLADLQNVTDRLVADAAAALVGQADPGAVGRPVRHQPGAAVPRRPRGEPAVPANVNDASSWQDATDTALVQHQRRSCCGRATWSSRARSDTTGPAAAQRDRSRDRPADRLDQDARATRSTPAGTSSPARRRRPRPTRSAASDTYAGDTEVVKREIGQGVQVPVNIAGSNVIGDGDPGSLLDDAARRSRPTCSADNSARAADHRPPGARRRARHAHNAAGDGRRLRQPARRPRLAGCSSSRSRPPQLLSDTEDADMAQTIDRLLAAAGRLPGRAQGGRQHHPTVPHGLPHRRRRSSMQIESTRFGTLEVRDDTVITFPDGLIGLPGTRYALVAQSEKTPFYWLHSVEDPDVAVPVTMPWLFFADYEVGSPTRRPTQLGSPSRSRPRSSASSAPPRSWRTSPSTCRPGDRATAEQRIGRQIINDGRRLLCPAASVLGGGAERGATGPPARVPRHVAASWEV